MQRLHHAEVEVVALAHLLDVPERLREVVLRVEEHDLDVGLRPASATSMSTQSWNDAASTTPRP